MTMISNLNEGDRGPKHTPYDHFCPDAHVDQTETPEKSDWGRMSYRTYSLLFQHCFAPVADWLHDRHMLALIHSRVYVHHCMRAEREGMAVPELPHALYICMDRLLC